MCSKGKKRERSINFSVIETECLVEQVLKRASIIENKRTDAVTWKQKENEWQDLTSTFNTLTAGNRTVKMLKVKYDGIKRTIKQKHNRMKSEQFKTGGGTAEVLVYSPWEEKLLRLISLSVEGLPSENDCDRVEQTNVDQSNIETYFVEHVDEDYADMIEMAEVITENSIPSTTENVLHDNTEKTIEAPNWNSWTPTTLKTPKHKKLKTPTERRAFEDKYSSMANTRKDLIDLQRKVAEQELAKISMEMEYLRKDDIRKEEQHQLRINFATKEHNEKIELMKLQKEQILK